MNASTNAASAASLKLKRAWIIGGVSALTLLLVVVYFALSFGYKYWMDAREERFLYRSEIRECFSHPPAHFEDLVDCLVAKSSSDTRRKIEAMGTRRREEIDVYLSSQGYMKAYVPNRTLGITTNDAKQAVVLYYIEENEPETHTAGGAFDIWKVFVDSHGRLLGWIPGSNPFEP